MTELKQLADKYRAAKQAAYDAHSDACCLVPAGHVHISPAADILKTSYQRAADTRQEAARKLLQEVAPDEWPRLNDRLQHGDDEDLNDFLHRVAARRLVQVAEADLILQGIDDLKQLAADYRAAEQAVEDAYKLVQQRPRRAHRELVDIITDGPCPLWKAHDKARQASVAAGCAVVTAHARIRQPRAEDITHLCFAARDAALKEADEL
jgi:hypothetical protein